MSQEHFIEISSDKVPRYVNWLVNKKARNEVVKHRIIFRDSKSQRQMTLDYYLFQSKISLTRRVLQ